MDDNSTARQFDQATRAAQDTVRTGTAAVSDAAGKAAETIKDVANSVKESATQSAPWRSAASLADNTSKQLAGAADYVRDTNSEDMWNDLVAMVKSKPVQSLAAAAVLGFVFGRSVRRS